MRDAITIMAEERRTAEVRRGTNASGISPDVQRWINRADIEFMSSGTVAAVGQSCPSCWKPLGYSPGQIISITQLPGCACPAWAQPDGRPETYGLGEIAELFGPSRGGRRGD